MTVCRSNSVFGQSEMRRDTNRAVGINTLPNTNRVRYFSNTRVLALKIEYDSADLEEHPTLTAAVSGLD